MDGFVGRKDLIPRERLSELTRRSNGRGALQTASHFGAIMATGYALHTTLGSLWAIPWFVLHGILINYLFAAQHEFNHYTVFETRWLNDVFNRVTGFLLLYPRSQERWFHYQHHRHTQDWDNDAELLAREGPYRLAPYLIYLLGISYWWNRVRRMFRDASGNVVGNYYTAPQRAHIIAEARWHLGLYGICILASMLLESAAMVTLWLAPMLVTKVFHQIQNITEHTGLIHANDTCINTRTIRTTRFMRWLAWNMQYHTAHHTYPAVPFHQLPKLHAEMVEALGFEPPTVGYIEFQIRFIRALIRGPEPYEGIDEVAAVPSEQRTNT